MAADMKYIYNLTPFLFICFCVCFCNGPGPIEKPVSIVEDSIVLKVGDMQITWYELNKNFDHYKKDMSGKNKRLPTAPEIRQWINDYTRRCYFLADAHAMGYYERKEIINAVAFMECFILSQHNGPLEQQLVKVSTPAFVPGKYYENIRTQANIVINKPVLQQVGNWLQQNGTAHEFNKPAFAGLLNEDLIQFKTAEGKIEHVSLSAFIDCYNSLPVQQYLVNANNVAVYLYKMAYASYLSKDAARLGITSSLKFRLDKKNYMNSLVYRRYKEQFFKDTAGNALVERFALIKGKYTMNGNLDQLIH